MRFCFKGMVQKGKKLVEFSFYASCLLPPEQFATLFRFSCKYVHCIALPQMLKKFCEREEDSIVSFWYSRQLNTCPSDSTPCLHWDVHCQEMVTQVPFRMWCPGVVYVPGGLCTSWDGVGHTAEESKRI